MVKYLLQAIMAEFTRTGIEEALLMKVLEHLQTICRLDGKFFSSDFNINMTPSKVFSFVMFKFEVNNCYIGCLCILTFTVL